MLKNPKIIIRRINQVYICKAMKLSLKEIWLISRPRFWMYVLGTFLVGMIAAGNPFQYDWQTNVNLVVLALFFSLPANLFIYGINDIYDYDTDKLNAKKTEYEKLLTPERHRKLWLIIGALTVVFLPFFIPLNTNSLIALAVFILAGFFYSANPLRAKAKPPLDILFSSIIYVSPAVIGFLATGSTNIEWLAVGGGIIWASAMQTFSAVPDIEADKKAGIRTLATQLGERNALIFCIVGYLVAGLIGSLYLGGIAIVFGLIYATLITFSLLNKKEVFRYYTYFPLINVLLGGLIYFYLFFGSI